MGKRIYLAVGCALAALVLSNAVPGFSAELWSEPSKTEQWSQPPEAKQWSESVPLDDEGEQPSESAGPVGGEQSPGEITESSTNQAGAGADFLADFERLYGTWYIWAPGHATNLYDKTTGNYATHEYDQGADQGQVTVNQNGTYAMSHAAWDTGTTVEGKWRLSYPAEINGERIQAIVLLDGITDVDWAVAPSSNGKIRLLYAMEWADGSATWVFDSDLYRE